MDIFIYTDVDKYNKNEKKIKENMRMIIWFILYILVFCCDLWSVWMEKKNKIFTLKKFKEEEIERLRDHIEELIR